ncbi:exodeoxyribonuclease V subunit gamma [Caldichromatium japonicum]|uniref:RecBCD enzyme subunit RecC n=1 Tax=Caldichromatium japonicum TaxID=2699430 RepID=A0A6G7VD09_9GAMM|nr:exodeoxyribonuclease V subunit gamma [Caldichromatium japonicum]QIK37790.1 exodeoxyribonuclease V subunit gamma [Caldichromatium japonicum]
MTDWPTGFMVIQGNRMEELRSLMVAWMGRYPLKPLENEVILVQSNGIAQWLKLALAAMPDGTLAGGQGIATALEVTLPARFVWRVYRAVLGALPESSPFDKGPLVWRIYRLFAWLNDPDSLPEQGPNLEALSPLRALLERADGVTNARRRYRLAEHLADLFDQYQVYRGDWLEAWSGGDDILIRANGERSGLPPDLSWQPALWRALSTDILASLTKGTDKFAGLTKASRVAVHRAFLAEAHTLSPRFQSACLPRRVIVFGLSALPQQTLEVLDAVARVSQVLLFVLNPSRHYWGDLIEGRDLFRRPYKRNSARKLPKDLDETSLHLHGHPLLAAWGRQGRDYLRLLDAHDERTRYETHFTDLAGRAEGIDLFASPGTGCLLHQLQDDILELRSLTERQHLQSVIDPERDRSLEFIVAHHPQREVEVLHDRLLAELDQAATSARPLEPREVLVMVPDISIYVPHIQAVFGRLERDDPRYIPFKITDQSERRQNPLLIGFEHLINLPHARLTVSEVLDWLDIPAFRARCGLDETALATLHHWIGGANIRWGLNGEHRTALGFPEGLSQHTWHFGLERLLLGFANGSAGPWRGIEPYAAIGGLEAALLGPLTELIARLRHYWRILSQARPVSDWAELVAALLDDFFVETNETEAITLVRIMQALDDWAAECAQGGLGDEPLPYEVFCDAFLPRLDQHHLQQHFVGGAVNFATLMPMRAIPFRQIWILGLNDGDYPRQRRPSDFDLMATDYRPGDRSRRDDDRYLLLEALLSARDKLVISWVGRDSHDTGPRQPSVLVTQLRDHLAAGWRLPAGHGGSLVEALTTVYPLQPFSLSYFSPQASPRIFTYAEEWQAAHGSGAEAKTAERALAPWRPESPIRLDELAAFLQSPVDALFHQRLRVPRADTARAPLDVEPFALTGLEFWQIRETLIDRCFVPGLNPDELADRLRSGIASLQAQGNLMDGPLGEMMVAETADALRALYANWSAALSAWPKHREQPLTIRLAIETPAGLLILEDDLYDLHLRSDNVGTELGAGQIVVTASTLDRGKRSTWKNAIRPWLRHLAAQLGGEPVETHLLTPGISLTFAPLPADDAMANLEALLGAWWQGMQGPLPVALAAGLAWIEQGGRDLTCSADQQQDNGAPSSIDENAWRTQPAWDEADRAFRNQDLAHSRHLQRCYPDFGTLWSQGAFASWAHLLYSRLYTALQDAFASLPRGKGQPG